MLGLGEPFPFVSHPPLHHCWVVASKAKHFIAWCHYSRRSPYPYPGVAHRRREWSESLTWRQVDRCQEETEQEEERKRDKGQRGSGKGQPSGNLRARINSSNVVSTWNQTNPVIHIDEQMTRKWECSSEEAPRSSPKLSSTGLNVLIQYFLKGVSL